MRRFDATPRRATPKGQQSFISHAAAHRLRSPTYIPTSLSARVAHARSGSWPVSGATRVRPAARSTAPTSCGGQAGRRRLDRAGLQPAQTPLKPRYDQSGRLRRSIQSDGTSRLTLCPPNRVKPTMELPGRCRSQLALSPSPPRPRAPGIDTTRQAREWGLLPDHQRGPTVGHQWGLFHGHGHRRATSRTRVVATRFRPPPTSTTSDDR